MSRDAGYAEGRKEGRRHDWGAVLARLEKVSRGDVESGDRYLRFDV